jgi:deoxyribonuclease-4
MLRCEQLEIPYLVTHPGSHVGAGEEAGLSAIAESLKLVFEELPECPTILLLENTAGQGTNLGHRFEHLARIRHAVGQPERIAVCFDTCHALAAGYDLVTLAGIKKVLKEFDEILGLNLLQIVHFNDSKKGQGSRVDRHEQLGKGCVGIEVFEHLINSRRFSKTPLILETPKSEDLQEDVEAIAFINNLRRLKR